MSVSATQIQILRTSIPNCRPDPSQLLPGQPAVNIDATDPGLYFTNSNGVLTKVGSCFVGSIAPNTTPAGSAGNSKGELWFDVQSQTLKVWTGSAWVDCDPSELGFTKVIISPVAPDLEIYPNGALWWNDYNGEMYVLYEDPNGRQWVQVGAGGSAGGGAVVISDQQPDPAITAVGTLWWNDDTGSLFVLFNDGGPEKLWIQIAGVGAINAGQGGSVSKIDAGTGLTTLNGQPITTQGTLLLKPATAGEIGGVKPGTNLTIDPDGTINMAGAGTGTVTQIQTGPGISGGPITTTGTLSLNTATSSVIGGVKPGAGTGVTGTGDLFIEPATNSSIGGVIVGNGLNVSSSGVIAVNPVPPGFIPSGIVQWYAGSTAPTGWLYCNGATLVAATFPDLYAAIGRTFTGSSVPGTSFQIPDLRGQFFRGWDNRSSGGVDNGRAFGSNQNSQNLSHNHGLQMPTIGYQAAFGGQREAIAVPTNQMNSQGRPNNGTIQMEDPDNQVSGSTPVRLAGGTESRPVNVALLPIIKL
jgi:microcystin-dependent protein